MTSLPSPSSEKATRRLRFAELFAGAGGLSMGLERAGWLCAFHAEIDASARAVLAHHWPNVPLYSDVVALSGGRKMKRWLQARHPVGSIDLISGGSPCQDLSVAGKRAGLGGARSSLFFRQMRLWKILGADLCLWENVDGARSSNNGKDFGEVLRAFVGAPVAVPSDGWRSAGVAAGPTGVAAWRVLDAQFLGVPQRRRRVFVLGTRTGRVDPAEVLSLAESLRGDLAPSREAREGSSADAGIGVEESRRVADTITANYGKQIDSRDSSKGPPNLVVAFGAQNSAAQGASASASAKCTPSLDKSKVPAVISFDWQKGNDVNNVRPSTMNIVEDATNTLGSTRVPAVLAFDERNVTSPTNRSNPQPGDPHHTLHDPPASIVCAFNETGHEKWTEEAIAGSLNAHEAREAREAHTILGTLNGSQRQQVDGAMTAQSGIPRRLMPVECEALMAWPRNHTDVPDAKGKPLSDAARYRLCGNGVASVHTHWIGWRLALALECSSLPHPVIPEMKPT